MSIDFEQAFPRFRNDSPPVMLLGGINLVRALGLAGIPAIVATADPEDPALDSRYCTATLAIPPLENEAAIEVLLDAGRRLAEHCGRRIPLMFGSDDALEAIARHRARLERYYAFLINDPSVSGGLIAKDRFQSFALDRGLPVPRALYLGGQGPGSVAGTFGPVLVKPRVKYDWHNTALCARLFDGDGKALIFPTGAAAAEHPEVQQNADQLLIQEYIPGGDRELWSYHGFADASGEVVAGFVGRKVRTFPTLTGESAFIELARDESLEQVGRDIARRCPLKGPFKMDFKRDPRDGRWHLLEINARSSLWLYVAAKNGANLAAAAYEYLTTGAARPQPAYRTTWRWLNLRLDYRAFRELAERGELSFLRWAASIVFSRNVYSLFAWEDPQPFLRFWRRRVMRKLTRPANRFGALLRPWRSTAS